MREAAVLDSSVIAAIFLPEEITEKAIDITLDHHCITIDLAFAEVGNVAWKRVLHGGFDPDEVREQYTDSIRFITDTCTIVPMHTLLEPAYSIACNTPVTMYDALFLAASDSVDAPLLTADQKMYTISEKLHHLILVK
ncbi:MAG: hypothetical protein APR55_04425 [Methanolinea sp. SDB]|nr:MAG: hypothetical protein APR55_04425 [Methanolinea sp. SDB]